MNILLHRAGALALVFAVTLPTFVSARDAMLRDKTLVAWVSPANLNQRGGSVLTIEKPGGIFEAIVLGEIAPAKWMPGSDMFRRTQQEQASYPTETVDNQTLVQIAIVYQDRQITLYRNGSQYASYTAAAAERFSSDSKVLMGLRHTEAAAENRFFTGSLEDARIYDLALTAAQIAALKPNQSSNPEPIAWWDFENGLATDRMKTFPTSTLFGEARINGGKLYLDTPGAFMMASRETLESGQTSTASTDAIEKKLKVDTTKSSLTEGPKSVEAGPFELKKDEPLNLRVFVDQSVVEVFANGRQAVMRRIYPSRADSVGLRLFANGGPARVAKLQAWDMMPSNPY